MNIYKLARIVSFIFDGRLYAYKQGQDIVLTSEKIIGIAVLPHFIYRKDNPHEIILQFRSARDDRFYGETILHEKDLERIYKSCNGYDVYKDVNIISDKHAQCSIMWNVADMLFRPLDYRDEDYGTGYAYLRDNCTGGVNRWWSPLF